MNFLLGVLQSRIRFFFTSSVISINVMPVIWIVQQNEVLHFLYHVK